MIGKSDINEQTVLCHFPVDIERCVSNELRCCAPSGFASVIVNTGTLAAPVATINAALTLRYTGVNPF